MSPAVATEPGARHRPADAESSSRQRSRATPRSSTSSRPRRGCGRRVQPSAGARSLGSALVRTHEDARRARRRCAKLGDPVLDRDRPRCRLPPADPERRRAMKRRLLLSYLSITAFVLLVLEVPFGVSYANSVERRLRATSSTTRSSSRSMRRVHRHGRDSVASVTSCRSLSVTTTETREAAGDRRPRGQGLRRLGSHPSFRSILNFDSPRDLNALGGGDERYRSSRTLDEALVRSLPVGSGRHPGCRTHHVLASVVDDRIRHIWLLLAATGGVVLGIVFLASPLLAFGDVATGELERAAVAWCRRPGGARGRAKGTRRGDDPRRVVQCHRCPPRTARGRSTRAVPTLHQLRTPRRAAPPAREPRGRCHRACGGGS